MSKTLNYGDTISIGIARDTTGSAVAAESGDVARVVFSKRSQPGRKIWRIASPSDPNATGPVNLADQIHIKTAADDGYLCCDLSGTASISSNPEPKQAAEWGIVSPDSNVTTNEIKFGETGLVLGSWLGRYLSRRAMSETDSRLTVDGAFADETSKWVFNFVPIRRTGARALLLNKANLAAAQIVTKAKTDKANTLAQAHQEAQTKLEAARAVQWDRLGGNLQKVFFLSGFDPGISYEWAYCDASGVPGKSRTKVDGRGCIAVDAAAEVIYRVSTDRMATCFLESARFDGSDKKRIASHVVLPGEGLLEGCVALDMNEGAAYWCLGNGDIVRTDLLTLETKSVARIPAPFGLTITMALDTINGKIFWANGQQLGSVNYDGSGMQIIFGDGGNTYPLNMLAVDGKHRCFYGCNAYEVWRSDFDNPSRQWVLPPNNQDNRFWLKKGPEYVGVAVDISAQLIYWFDLRTTGPADALLHRSPIELYNRSDMGSEPRHVKDMFRVPSSLPGQVVLATSSETAADKVFHSTVRLNNARVAAPRMIAQAHLDAAQTVVDAHAKLAAAHAKAEVDIPAKQVDAANQRQLKRSEAAEKHLAADLTLSEARRYDTDKRLTAKDDAQKIRDSGKRRADRITQSAQARLDAARRKQQNS